MTVCNSLDSSISYSSKASHVHLSATKTSLGAMITDLHAPTWHWLAIYCQFLLDAVIQHGQLSITMCYIECDKKYVNRRNASSLLCTTRRRSAVAPTAKTSPPRLCSPLHPPSLSTKWSAHPNISASSRIENVQMFRDRRSSSALPRCTSCRAC